MSEAGGGPEVTRVNLQHPQRWQGQFGDPLQVILKPELRGPRDPAAGRSRKPAVRTAAAGTGPNCAGFPFWEERPGCGPWRAVSYNREVLCSSSGHQ